MNLKTELKKLIKGKISSEDLYSYFLGNYRYWLYYNAGKSDLGKYGFRRKKPWLMRRFIWEQINLRIEWMDEECYNNGECKMCGCSTTALQMADKACDKPCYPQIMSKRSWQLFSVEKESISFDEGKTVWVIRDYKLLQFIHKNNQYVQNSKL